MRKSLFFIAFIGSVTTCFAQAYEKRPWMPTENRIGVAIGIGTTTYHDKNVSPLIYKSQPKSVRIFYNLETNKMLFALDIDFKIGSTSSKYHPNRTIIFNEEKYNGESKVVEVPATGTLMMGNVSLGIFHKIPSTQESTFKVAVGGRLTNELFYPQGWTTAGIFNALSFSPAAMVQLRINEHNSFNATLKVPAISSLSRMPYDNTVSQPESSTLKGFFSNSEWVGPGKYLSPSLSLGYNYQINTKWGAGMSYDFTWYRITAPNTMHAVNQNFLLNLYHQF